MLECVHSPCTRPVINYAFSREKGVKRWRERALLPDWDILKGRDKFICLEELSHRLDILKHIFNIHVCPSRYTM